MAKLKLQKLFKKENVHYLIMAVVGGLVLTYALNLYSHNKLSELNPFKSSSDVNTVSENVHSGYMPSSSDGSESQNASAAGMTTDNYGLPPSCTKQSVVDPKELLPRDTNSDFAKLNPMGSGDLANVNLLKAGHHIGINTIGQSLRNANLQLRSDPPIVKQNVGPFLQSTITGDNVRRKLELH